MIQEKLKVLIDQGTRRDRKRLMLVSSLVIACLILTAFGLYTQVKIQVTVNVNGAEQIVQTDAKTVEQLLRELEINYKSQDRIQPELHTELVAGMEITWKEAKKISMNRYGESQDFYTTVDTVDDFLHEQGIVLQEGDLVTPSGKSAIREGMNMEVASYSSEIVDEEQVIAFHTIRKKDPSLLIGQQKEALKGKDGKRKHQYLVTYKNGSLMNKELLGSEVLEEKTDEVVAVGTIASISRGSYVFSPRNVLENVILTAYAAGPSHTGKSPGDVGYGITRSGTTATEGRTIAVDPNVIPLGTWVYIEGIGLRKAEDTGSAVKGKKIDVYFEDDATANRFGLKRGYKVYVIGKFKPEEKQ